MHPAEALMARYGEAINGHDFDALAAEISEGAIFWFSSGSHEGLPAIRAAFEATWAKIQDEHYAIEGLRWLALGEDAALCTYRFRWRGCIEGLWAEGGGRGTTGLRREAAGWRIVHEHLSHEPSAAGG